MRYWVSVLRGEGRGRNLKFPTLNFLIPKDFPYPHGIYVGHVFIGTDTYEAAIHFGPIPTFDESTPTLEAFLLDTNLKTPPTHADIELVSKIREIKKFENSALLIAQIENDVALIKTILKKNLA